MKNWVLRRLAEPSSHAAIASAISVGSAWGNGAMTAQVALPGLIFSLLGIFVPELLAKK